MIFEIDIMCSYSKIFRHNRSSMEHVDKFRIDSGLYWSGFHTSPQEPFQHPLVLTVVHSQLLTMTFIEYHIVW